MNKDSIFQRAFDALVDMFGSPAMGPAFAGILLVLYLGFSDSADPVENSNQTTQVASSAPVNSAITPVAVQSPRRLAGVQENSLIQFQRELERLRAASAARSDARRRSPLVIPVVPVIESRRAFSGFRSQGADIDWIRANRDFNLYQSKDRSDPPVIWVAREGRKAPRKIADEIR